MKSFKNKRGNDSVVSAPRSRDLVLAFDESARQEFVGGFHKRKVERRQNYMNKMKSKEKEEKLELRKAKADMRRGARDSAIDAINRIEAMKAGPLDSNLSNGSDGDNEIRVKTKSKVEVAKYDGLTTSAIVSTEPMNFSIANDDENNCAPRLNWKNTSHHKNAPSSHRISPIIKNNKLHHRKQSTKYK